MFDRFSDGYCPECLLGDKQVPMVLNASDYWECPSCHLQAHSASAGMFAILRKRGEGQLRSTKATEFVVGNMLTKDRGEEYQRADSCGFNDEDELRSFIANELK